MSVASVLEDEHRVIAKVVGITPVLADKLAAGQTVAGETFRNIVEFMHVYADQCHHGKEEALLFPALGNKGVPLQGCPVGALTAEHVKGRAFVKQLAESLDAYERGDPAAKDALIQSLRGIAELYPNHIWKEDYLLFPLTDKVLSPEEQQSLCREFEVVEDRIGRDVHRQLERLAEQLAQSV